MDQNWAVWSSRFHSFTKPCYALREFTVEIEQYTGAASIGQLWIFHIRLACITGVFQGKNQWDWDEVKPVHAVKARNVIRFSRSALEPITAWSRLRRSGSIGTSDHSPSRLHFPAILTHHDGITISSHQKSKTSWNKNIVFKGEVYKVSGRGNQNWWKGRNFRLQLLENF